MCARKHALPCDKHFTAAIWQKVVCPKDSVEYAGINVLVSIPNVDHGKGDPKLWWP